MNKFIIVLQDKETIKEIANDPDVQIKIKDAIIDGIAKRVAKGAFEVNSGITRKITDDCVKALFDKTFYERSFTNDYKQAFDNAVNKLIEESVKKNIKEIEDKVNDSVKRFQHNIDEFLFNFDLEKSVRRAIDNKINDIVKKLVEK